MIGKYIRFGLGWFGLLIILALFIIAYYYTNQDRSIDSTKWVPKAEMMTYRAQMKPIVYMKFENGRFSAFDDSISIVGRYYDVSHMLDITENESIQITQSSFLKKIQQAHYFKQNNGVLYLLNESREQIEILYRV
ncbi:MULTISPECIES: hypothetical protein [Cysteiniphilum]|uniref:Uncharacterized protein n=1 Tax=Cysteiniphilum litorale TaxID=2056700 RepID=A0A8J3EAB9_9GAMM|nr:MULTISPECIES: hypothetical protein [Cysteiniphilum]GGG09070.1 hypothetical protein GCM10010995_28320 [Cysteiniphilum litorale]